MAEEEKETLERLGIRSYCYWRDGIRWSIIRLHFIYWKWLWTMTQHHAKCAYPRKTYWRTWGKSCLRRTWTSRADTLKHPNTVIIRFVINYVQLHYWGCPTPCYQCLTWYTYWNSGKWRTTTTISRPLDYPPRQTNAVGKEDTRHRTSLDGDNTVATPPPPAKFGLSNLGEMCAINYLRCCMYAFVYSRRIKVYFFMISF